MNSFLEEDGQSIDIPRKKAKQAVVTAVYGATVTPLEIFDDDKGLLEVFKDACLTEAYGAFSMLPKLIAAWQPFVLGHRWVLPDLHTANIAVIDKKEVRPRIEVDGLNHRFTTSIKSVEGSAKGISLVANVTHS